MTISRKEELDSNKGSNEGRKGERYSLKGYGEY
jgi:hypothetical protein